MELVAAGDTWKRLLVLALVLVVVIGIVAPIAHAYVYENGYLNCGSKWVKIRSYSWGTTYHYRDMSQIGGWYDSMYTVHYSHTGRHAANWEVRVYWGALQSGPTYAYCVSYG